MSELLNEHEENIQLKNENSSGERISHKEIDVENAEARMEVKEEQPVSEEEARAVALEYKKKGNEFFASQNYDESIEQYTLAIRELQKAGVKDHIILGNRSAAYLGLKRYVPALRDAQLAAEAEPTWWKAHWRSGLALMGMVPRKFRTEQAIKAFEACRGCPEFPATKEADLQSELQKAYARLQQQENEVSMPENCTIS